MLMLRLLHADELSINLLPPLLAICQTYARLTPRNLDLHEVAVRGQNKPSTAMESPAFQFSNRVVT